MFGSSSTALCDKEGYEDNIAEFHFKKQSELGLSWKNFFDALENTIKFHQIYVWIQASFLSSCFKCHKI